MKITVCYIVKNETAELRRSLESLQSLQPDDCIFVNTEENAAIAALAGEWAGAYYFFAWRRDFSAARNFALSKIPADTDWVVFLDADEYFAQPPDRSLLVNQPEECQALSLVLRHLDGEDRIISSSAALRIFRYSRELHYAGRIHEQPCRGAAPLTAVQPVPAAELFLYHTGYAGNTREKAERNLSLLREAMAQGEDEVRLYGYLAEACEGLCQRSESLRYAEADMARGRQPVSYASRSWRVALRLAATHEERLRFSTSAAEHFPELPDFRAEHAVALAEQADYAAAVREMERAIAIGIRYTGLEPCDFDAEMQCTAQKLLSAWREKLIQAQKLRIVACVICRNEEVNLPGWLAQMQQLAAHRIVVDTGSVDRTAALARAAGAEVCSFAWRQDFAAAKNAALAKVDSTADWIIFLDADEYFTKESLQRLRCLLAREAGHTEIAALLCRIINIDIDDGGKEIDRFVNVRIFRAGCGLHYEGIVHEQLCTREGETPKLLNVENELVIYHTGYSGHRIRQKLERNLALLQQDIARQGEKPSHYAQLADCYFGLGDYEKVIQYARKHIQAGIICVGREDIIYDHLIRAEYMHGEADSRILADMREYRHRYPGSKTLLILEQDIQKYKKKQADTQEEINMTENTTYARSAEAKPDDNDAAVVSSNDELKELERQQRQKTAAAIPIDMEAIRQKVLAGDFSSGYQKSSLAIGARIQELLASLLMPGVLEQLEKKHKLGQIWNVLTEPMKRIIQRYFDGISFFLPIDYGTYWAFFPAILRFCPQSVIHRYVECGLDFSETNQLYRMALQLKESFFYQDAAFVLDELFAVEENAAEGIYLSAGIVYYGAGRLDDAEKCFNRWEGNEKIEGQIAAYKTWISERKRENW